MLPGTSERSQRYTFLHVSFSNSFGLASVHPPHRVCRLRRFYLSLDILGFGNQPRRTLLYNVTEPIVQKLREQMDPIYKRVRVLEDSYARCPRPMADFIIDIFYEPDRIYCGCFCYEPRIMANSHFVKTMRKIREDNPEAFTGLASIRQLKGEENVKCRLRELGIDRGAFLNLLPEWGWRNEISPNFISFS